MREHWDATSCTSLADALALAPVSPCTAAAAEAEAEAEAEKALLGPTAPMEAAAAADAATAAAGPGPSPIKARTMVRNTPPRNTAFDVASPTSSSQCQRAVSSVHTVAAAAAGCDAATAAGGTPPPAASLRMRCATREASVSGDVASSTGGAHRTACTAAARSENRAGRQPTSEMLRCRAAKRRRSTGSPPVRSCRTMNS